MKIYVDPAPKPTWLDEVLSTLILVDEEPEHSAPTTRELETILEKPTKKTNITLTTYSNKSKYGSLSLSVKTLESLNAPKCRIRGW